MIKNQNIIAVSGVKNSGKTTLITSLISVFTSKGYQVAAIKHDGHDFEADTRGTDSFLFKTAGAYGTAVFSKNRFMTVKDKEVSERDLIPLFSEADLIFLEGFKNSDYPKIEVVRSAVSQRPVCRQEHLLALVSDVTDLGEKYGRAPVIPFGQTGRLAELIEAYLSAGSAADIE